MGYYPRLFVGKEAPQPQPIVIDLAEGEDFECPADGMFADEGNGCESYYVCHSGKFWKFTCNPGLLFDDAVGGCTWPSRVQC